MGQSKAVFAHSRQIGIIKQNDGLACCACECFTKRKPVPGRTVRPGDDGSGRIMQSCQTGHHGMNLPFMGLLPSADDTGELRDRFKRFRPSSQVNFDGVLHFHNLPVEDGQPRRRASHID
ncbi:hypothetical protein D3C73_1183750 [compost metagenome]